MLTEVLCIAEDNRFLKYTSWMNTNSRKISQILDLNFQNEFLNGKTDSQQLLLCQNWFQKQKLLPVSVQKIALLEKLINLMIKTINNCWFTKLV